MVSEWLGASSTNVPSYRLMERIGMRREAHAVKGALHPSGEWMDGYEYALLAEEWHHRHQSPKPPSAPSDTGAH